MGKFVKSVDHFFDFCKENEVKFVDFAETPLPQTPRQEGQIRPPEAIKFKINLQDKSAADNQLASVKYRQLPASHAKCALF